MRYWWLSFCDAKRPEGQQFLGCAVVAASRPDEAIRVAWILGCNPGGEVRSIAFEATAPLPARLVGRLLQRAEAESADTTAAIKAVLAEPTSPDS